LALVALSVVEQRLDAVRAVLAGAEVTEVAVEVGVSRQSLHTWIGRYLVDGVGGLSDRSHRPKSCPHQVATEMEVRVAEMRREHPRWGAKRVRMELLRQPVEGLAVPSVATINRILRRQGLVKPRPRKRPRDSFKRFERSGPMLLWQIDIVGGIVLVDPNTGVLREGKVVTGVDDHSRFCVIAQVVERATARAVCLAFAQALIRFGVPEEVLTDNGKQFTDRFGRHGSRNGEVLFDKICRKNGITHRLTRPQSPNQNGKVERFHGTFRPDFLDPAEPFTSVEAAQAAVDRWVSEYNSDRPHQGLDDKLPVTPDDRFQAVPPAERALIDLWLPPALEAVTHVDPPAGEPASAVAASPAPSSFDQSWAEGAIEFDRLIPPSGNLSVANKQFWLGPARAGLTVRFWADVDVIHLMVGGARVKSVRSHLTVNDLRRLIGQGAINAGSPPLPPPEDGEAIEVDRVVSKAGTICLDHRIVLAAEILAGRQVGIRIETNTLMFFDLDTRELLRTRPNPLALEQMRRIRGARKAGPPPRPSTEPIQVQRRADTSGTVMVCGQKVALGRGHKHQTVTIAVSETTLAIELVDGDTRIVRRTTTQPVRSIKSHRPRTGTTNT
jgi:transposase InsO family protein